MRSTSAPSTSGLSTSEASAWTRSGRHSSAEAASPSPYELALGDRLGGLHPRLRAYFAAIPPGHVGIGTGVFETVGTRRRWAFPVLSVLARQHVLFPVWAERVPFSVENRPVGGTDGADGAVGAVGVSGLRTFHLDDGDRVMIDQITASPVEGGIELADLLGPDQRLRAVLEASVVEGELHLRSRHVSVRIGSVTVSVPRPLAPVVRLIERFDDDTDRQQVEVTVTLPLVGRIYEYSGAFAYEIVPESTTAEEVDG